MNALLQVVAKRLRRTLVAATTGERLFALSAPAFILLLLVAMMLGLIPSFPFLPL